MGRRTNIAVSLLSPDWREHMPGAAVLGRRVARAALKGAAPKGLALGDAPIELSLVLADDGLVHRLNRQYRGIDRSTNVLSFGSWSAESAAPADMPVMLGDVVLARETVVAEAAMQGKALADHFSHLVVHGVLHLLGYDHEHAGEAEMMEALEVSVLAKLGIANPYSMEVDPGSPAHA
jgi:probable rRNA maturation factor